MGYYNYQQGLLNHHLNQEENWNNHNRQCRSFILRAVDFFRPEKITVLGSGWLLDLPLAEMADKTGKIVLIDIIHPPEVVAQTSGIKNVELVEEDITGGLIKEVWEKAGRRNFLNRLPTLDAIHIPDYQPADDPGMVISLNILTQLEILPGKLLKQKSKASESQFIKFREEIQKKHLLFLAKHKSVLMTDIAELVTDSKGNKTGRPTLAVQLPEGRERDEWIWDFDLLGNDFRQKKFIFKIAAIMF